jgi:hypothetical protein
MPHFIIARYCTAVLPPQVVYDFEAGTLLGPPSPPQALEEGGHPPVKGSPQPAADTGAAGERARKEAEIANKETRKKVSALLEALFASLLQDDPPEPKKTQEKQQSRDDVPEEEEDDDEIIKVNIDHSRINRGRKGLDKAVDLQKLPVIEEELTWAKKLNTNGDKDDQSCGRPVGEGSRREEPWSLGEDWPAVRRAPSLTELAGLGERTDSGLGQELTSWSSGQELGLQWDQIELSLSRESLPEEAAQHFRFGDASVEPILPGSEEPAGVEELRLRDEYSLDARDRWMEAMGTLTDSEEEEEDCRGDWLLPGRRTDHGLEAVRRWSGVWEERQRSSAFWPGGLAGAGPWPGQRAGPWPGALGPSDWEDRRRSTPALHLGHSARTNPGLPARSNGSDSSLGDDEGEMGPGPLGLGPGATGPLVPQGPGAPGPGASGSGAPGSGAPGSGASRQLRRRARRRWADRAGDCGGQWEAGSSGTEEEREE